MADVPYVRTNLGGVKTKELCVEIARRFNIRFGKVHLVFHDGRPSKYADVDVRVELEPDRSKSAS